MDKTIIFLIVSSFSYHTNLDIKYSSMAVQMRQSQWLNVTEHRSNVTNEEAVPDETSILDTINSAAMQFTKLVPELYYRDIQEGLKMFVDCLEFRISHSELHSGNPFCVVEKDTLSVMLFENKEYAEQFTPLLRLVTDNIDEVYNKVSSTYPELLHPNLNKVTLRPWGAKEFALLDKQIGIVIQQW